MSKVVESLSKLRDLPDGELVGALARVRDELFRLRIASHTNQVTSSAQRRGKRREIARIQTILHARGLGLEAQGSKGKSK